MAAEKLFAALLALTGGDTIEEMLRANELLVTQLLDLQQRVRSGELVPLAELGLAAPTREEILSGLDVRAALKLGIEPSAVRDRLAPGFDAELDQLATQREKLLSGPPSDPSPLLTLMLDFEVEMKALQDRRRQSLRLKNPLDSGPLASTLQPEGAPGPAVVDGVDAAAPADGGSSHRPRPSPVDARLAAAALYRAGRWQEALDAWGRMASDAKPTIEEEYQRADCLMRLTRADEAIEIWEKIAAEHADTPWGAQSTFSLKVARALSALQRAKQPAAGGKS